MKSFISSTLSLLMDKTEKMKNDMYGRTEIHWAKHTQISNFLGSYTRTLHSKVDRTINHLFSTCNIQEAIPLLMPLRNPSTSHDDL